MKPQSATPPRPPRHSSLLAIAAFLLTLAVTIGAEIQPSASPLLVLPRAHAHNDYEHPRPLLDALDHGFCSVEADIHLVDGDLLVAHDLDQTQPARTLEALYLDPLRERVRRHHGKVYPAGPELILLIDIKSEADATYAVLRERLLPYSDMLTRFETNRIVTNAVTVILSGNRPRQMLLTDPIRHAAYDGRLSDLESDAPAAFIPLVSDNWRNHFLWRGQVPFPEAERLLLDRLVERAHQQGRRIRFWAAPDEPAAWKILYEAGVDLINTDDLSGLRDFLTQGMSSAKSR
jgi:hypothetical protein